MVKDEFVALFTRDLELPQDIGSSVFHFLDSNGDNEISLADLKKGTRTFSEAQAAAAAVQRRTEYEAREAEATALEERQKMEMEAVVAEAAAAKER